MLYASGKLPEAYRLAPFPIWGRGSHGRMSAARGPSVHLLPWSTARLLCSHMKGCFSTMLSVSHVVQGIIVGGVLAFLTANIIMNAVVKAMTTTVNGWSTTLKCGQPGNGILLRAACARILPAVNVVQEAAYWTTTVDSAGQTAERPARLRPAFSCRTTPAERCLLVADHDRCCRVHGE